MSFGTGHHATTQLMVEQLAALSIQGKRVLDIGTGTGVLAILAKKMGATVVCATESEDWGYENARANFLENNCPDIELVQTEGLPVSFSSFDIIIANINKNTILQLLPLIKEKANMDAILLLSGWLTSDNSDMIDGLVMHGVAPVSTVVKGDWSAMRCRL
jgi:ribosomal protein L11 methyltransferase